MKLINFPNQPDSANREAASSLYGLYKAYVDVGFTKQQAMDIILTMLRASLANPSPNKGA